jgi:hypothetical protein
MNVFSARSIGLYSLAIGSAIGFFQIVTSYGEANIKAPIAVTGNYSIAAQNLPGCLQHKPLLLKLQQSGIYLNANLAIDRVETTASKDIRPTFSGRLRDLKASVDSKQQLDLSGILSTTICPQISQLRMAGSITKISAPADRNLQLQGQLWLTSKDSPQASPVDFTATLQPSTQSTQSH